MDVVEAGKVVMVDRRHPSAWFHDEENGVIRRGQLPTSVFFCNRDFTLVGDDDSRKTALALVTNPVSIQVFKNVSSRRWF